LSCASARLSREIQRSEIEQLIYKGRVRTMSGLNENELSFQEADYLASYRRIITSQYGEDGVIEKIFEIIKDGDKWCVEFGAGDGKTLSNTYNLVLNKQWRAVEIEANKNLYKKLLQTYNGKSQVTCFNKKIDFEGKDTLDNILLKTPIPRDFDLLSIDINGNDYHIWDSIEIYRPKVIIIEYNPTIPNDVEFVQPRDMKINQGSSLFSLVKLSREKGYELVAVLEVNALFVKAKYYPLFKIKDNSVDLIRKSHQYETRLFQLFDGTLVLTGYRSLIWHALEINQKRIQVVPEFLRKEPGQMNFLERNLLIWLRYKRQGIFHLIFKKSAGYFKIFFASVKRNKKI
jgi:hypothetical protein